MKASLLFIATFFLTLSLSAQVVNTEKLRLKNTDKSFAGDIDFTLGLSQNKAGQTLRFNGFTRFDIIRPQTHWLFIGGYGFSQFKKADKSGDVPTKFNNNGFTHLRFGQQISPVLTWEVFAQGQFDEVQEVEARILNGTGPRFKILKTDTSHLFLGTLYMYEYEKNNVAVTDDTGETTQNLHIERNHRLSAYISGAVTIKGYLSINHVTYYQPKLNEWSDFRISSETTVTIKLTNRVALKTYFQLVFDEKPPTTVPQTMFNLSNGLSVSF